MASPSPTSSPAGGPSQAKLLPCANAERKAGVPEALVLFRGSEGRAAREAKLRELWAVLPSQDPSSPTGSASSSSQPPPLASSAAPASSSGQPALASSPQTSSSSSSSSSSLSSSTSSSPAFTTSPGLSTTLSPERADALQALYREELVRRVHATKPSARHFAGEGVDLAVEANAKVVDWKGFRAYLWEKEAELWNAFQDLDRDHDGVIDINEMRNALSRADITLTPETLQEFVNFLASGKEKMQSKEITWVEFRDMLLMLPRSASVPEIYRFYQVRRRYPDGRGAARVTSEGDSSPSFPSSLAKPKPASPPTSAASPPKPPECAEHGEDDFDEEEHDQNGLSAMEALKFLGAGGIAGAVSRTATAPFDRLKIFLITDSTSISQSDFKPVLTQTFQGWENLKRAVLRLYIGGGGLKSFWVGNGLNVIKIMPESAIKFFSYEASKRFLARYWDQVDDPSLISGSSRFLSGGMGGIFSQFAIYPLETLKTQHMTTAGSDHSSKVLLRTAAAMWANGGVRRYYRGLTLGLVGVFPYAAIDMSTFETLKISYCRSMEIEEPETYAVLAFGAISGGVGATSVYPINVLRTKLQASGSTGHPQTYTGFYDVASQTVAREGWRGLYKGLTVTLAKVVPAVSISYVIYERSKRAMGI